MAMEEFKLLLSHLDRLSEEVSEYLLAVEEPAQFQYRKGYLDGHNRTKNLIYTLISLGEEGDSEWMAKELEKSLEPFRAMALPRGRMEAQEAEAVVNRLSRVLKAVQEGRLTGGSSTQP